MGKEWKKAVRAKRVAEHEAALERTALEVQRFIELHRAACGRSPDNGEIAAALGLSGHLAGAAKRRGALLRRRAREATPSAVATRRSQ
jgi:hypothetical protein